MIIHTNYHTFHINECHYLRTYVFNHIDFLFSIRTTPAVESNEENYNAVLFSCTLSFHVGNCSNKVSVLKCKMMKYSITQDKLFKLIEWILFIGFSIQTWWFASGALEQFFSQKTSFSLSEEINTEYPVVTIVPLFRLPSEINSTNIVITYFAEGMELVQGVGDFSKSMTKLEIGENYLHNIKYNTTDKVILKSLTDLNGGIAFQINHTTPILEKKRTFAVIEMYTKLENNSLVFADIMGVKLTSHKNSPGAKAFPSLEVEQYHFQIITFITSLTFIQTSTKIFL